MIVLKILSFIGAMVSRILTTMFIVGMITASLLIGVIIGLVWILSR